MSTTADFGDFVLSTTKAYLRGPRVVIREAVEQTYLFGDLMVGAGMRDLLQGGAKISDSLTLEDPGTAKLYGAGDDVFEWDNPQNLVEWNIDWRFALTHFSWTDHERMLQGAGDMTQRARFMKFKDVYDNKVGQAYLSLYNLLEALLWAEPLISSMETASGLSPYSIPAFVNEDTNGLFARNGTTWTTVEGIAPATHARWVPAQDTYDNFTGGSAVNVLTGFDRLCLELNYRPFRGGKDYFERSMRDRKMICCSKNGYSKATATMRAEQDLYVGSNRQDPFYDAPMHNGVPLVYVSTLDSATLYDDGSSDNTTEALANITGPRYYFLDAKYMRPVFHRDRFIKQHSVKEHPNQPFTKVVPIDVWYNMPCRSRQRLGILSPSTDLQGATS